MRRLPQLCLFLSLFGIMTSPVASQDCNNLWVQLYETGEVCRAKGLTPGTRVCRAAVVAVTGDLLAGTGDLLAGTKEPPGIGRLPTLASAPNPDLIGRIEACKLQPVVVHTCNRMAHCHDDPPPSICTPTTLSFGLNYELEDRRTGFTGVLEHEWKDGKSWMGEITFTPDALPIDDRKATNRNGADQSGRDRREDVLTLAFGPRLYFGGDRDGRFRLFYGASFVAVTEPSIEVGAYPFVGLQTKIAGRRVDLEAGYRYVESSRLDGFAVKVRLRFGKRKSAPVRSIPATPPLR